MTHGCKGRMRPAPAPRFVPANMVVQSSFPTPRSSPATVEHPARWSRTIIDALTPILTSWRLPVHDPFGGTGERLGYLCDTLGLAFSGTEIEPEFIVDQRVRPGDSTDAASYPTGKYCVVTSPTYPNGMSDHFQARDGSKRHTYRQALATNLGYDRPLDDHNMGAYGIRRGGRSEAKYWQLADSAVKHWPDRVVVNVSDFISNHVCYPLVAKWEDLLQAHGYTADDVIKVATPRQRHGANGAARVDAEAVIVARR